MNRCPLCNSPKITPLGRHWFRCATCGAHFDNDPGEGGDYSDRNPSARLERQEREAMKKRTV